MGAYLKPEFPPLLPDGFHPMTLADLRALCVSSRGPSLTRARIVEGLDDLVGRLVRAAVLGEVWIDGSFVTEKVDPEDVDILIHALSSQYDSDASVRAAVDWASHAD